ncbi:transcriptional regulator, XRE family [Parafrankia sp. EAN1pec]|uniref:transcriptional regulator n=1 Tax=Parafrankia sp. (strain EAN1pec) TaxID=298653 RepID=UPI0000542E9E|nr:transcriptional regulator, XRE family [Frankia sp. EAN1pec]
MSTTSENRAYAHEVGARLRAIRTQQGHSLQQVETRSGGRWKVAAVGSYERGDRMINIEGLAALAAFYGVPVHHLLPGGRPDALPPQAARVVLNLPALARVPADDAGPLRRWVAEIQRERDDYAGRVLSIREGDLRTLATLYALDRNQLLDMLQQWKVLDPMSTIANTSDTAETQGP